MDFSACSKAALAGVLPAGADIDKVFPLYLAENDRLWSELECGEITREQLKKQRFVNFKKKTGLDFDPGQMSVEYMEALSHQAIFLPGAAGLLEELSKRTKLYMVSNGISMIQRGRIAAGGIEKYFDGIFISEEIGEKKPDKAYFDHVLRNIPERKEDILLVGDSVNADIAGAMNAGIDTCWISRGRDYPLEKQPTFTAFGAGDLLKMVIDKIIAI